MSSPSPLGWATRLVALEAQVVELTDALIALRGELDQRNEALKNTMPQTRPFIGYFNPGQPEDDVPF